MASKYFDKIREKIPEETKVFVSMSLDIVDQIHYLLNERGITQRELAKKLGKSESEISKWLSATHNMTLKTLAKLTVALDGIILETPLKKTGYYDKITFQDEGKSKTKIIPIHAALKQNTSYTNIKFESPKHKIAFA